MYCPNCGSKLNNGICPNCSNNEKKTNIYAIIGFILSFIVSTAGLIFSIIGFKKSKDLNDGKSLSIAGIIISSILLVLKIIFIVLTIIGYLYMFNMKSIVKGNLKDRIEDAIYNDDIYDFDDDTYIENVTNNEVIEDIYDKDTFILILNDISQDNKNELINIIKEKNIDSLDFDIYMTNYTSKLSSLISADTKYAIVIKGNINTYKVDEYVTFKNDINKYLLGNIDDIIYDSTKLYEITDDYEKWPTIKTNKFKYEKVYINKEMAVVGAYGITNITNTGIGAQIYVKFYDENKNYLTEFNTLKCVYYTNTDSDNLFYLKPNEIKSISFPMYEVDESGCGIDLEKFKQIEYFSIENL